LNKIYSTKKGNWWLPDQKEKQFHGELNFNQTEGGTLILSDTLDKLYDFPTRNEEFIILGNLTEDTGNDSKPTKVSVIIKN
jgi:ApeA N-terminal domain 1